MSGLDWRVYNEKVIGDASEGQVYVSLSRGRVKEAVVDDEEGGRMNAFLYKK